MSAGTSARVRPAVSACVIARDAAPAIRHCLASLAWVDECVVVVDPRSRDDTEAIARELGATVVSHPYAGNVEQKNVALDLAKHDWVVALDADEALSDEARDALLRFLADAPEGAAGVELNRVTRHLGRWLRHGDFHPDWQLRLFRRSRGRWAGANPHGRVRVEGGVHRVTGDLTHESYADLADQVARVQSFSAIEAQRLHAAGRRARWSDLVLRPPARFLRAYLLKSGWRDGMPGFAVAAVTAFHVFLKYAKLWELERRAAGETPRRR